MRKDFKRKGSSSFSLFHVVVVGLYTICGGLYAICDGLYTVCIRFICGFVYLEFLWCGCISLWVVGCVYMMGIL